MGVEVRGKFLKISLECDECTKAENAYVPSVSGKALEKQVELAVYSAGWTRDAAGRIYCREHVPPPPELANLESGEYDATLFGSNTVRITIHKHPVQGPKVITDYGYDPIANWRNWKITPVDKGDN